MLLNPIEYALTNSSIRAAIQRRFEAKRLLSMGGPVTGTVLEVGCGRGVGIEIILDTFGAAHVDAFDLDARMVKLAKRRTRRYDDNVALWIGDATAIPIDDESYDTVFDFAIIHHIPNWRDAVSEIYRVLKPGGRLYAGEVLSGLINRFPWRQLLTHPREDRFDKSQFCQRLTAVGLSVVASFELRGRFAWFIAEK